MTNERPNIFPVIAIVGMPGSGKSVLAHYLIGRGVHVIRFGQYIINEVVRRNLDINPQNEKIVREDLREKHGMDVCAQLAFSEIEEMLNLGKRVAIDGLYSLSEYETLSSRLGNQLIVIAVFSSKPIRYSRLLKRAERPLTEQEARERDLHEIKNIEKGGPIALADYTLINDGSPEDLIRAFESVLSSLRITTQKNLHSE